MIKRWLDTLAGGNTVYYPGCVTRYALPEIEAKYLDLLRRAGVDFIVLPGEALCCGSPVKRAGYMTDFDELKAKNLAVFESFSARKVITNCPGCYHTLKNDYGLDAYHAAQILEGRLSAPTGPSEEPLRRSEEGGGGATSPLSELTYHDPCHLGRWSDVYDEPRRLLEGTGWAVTELPDNREHSLCCGAGGGLKSNFPDLANDIARQRLAEVETGRLCTACPLCYAHFKESAEETEVLELSEALTQGFERESSS